MPQSLARILVHVTFSTKNRTACLSRAIQKELYAYTAAVLKNLRCSAIQIGGVADHVHILCVLSKNVSVAQLVEAVKKPTSKWLKSKGPAFTGFHWQAGYGAFSVSQSNVEKVRAYIANQEKHHRKLSFEEEFRRLLGKHRVAYDERYLWD
ncbi:transposase [candidate division BRC1 bacterium SM23_51]|nr:MAG: transposase [candidate division BRC1 bacterium SM23_51]